MDKTTAPYGGVASPSELGGGRKKEKWRLIPFTSPGLCYFLRLDQERLTTVTPWFLSMRWHDAPA
jgi:hypothetical protein